MLGHSPLSSRPLSDVAAQERLAVLAVTEDDDTLVATAVVLPLAGGGVSVRRPKPRLIEVELPPKPIRARLAVTEDDDELEATAVISLRARLGIFEDDDTLDALMALGEAPKARIRRQALSVLLMH